MANRVEELRSALSRFPRVSLLGSPTPLVEASRLTARLDGPRILFKREDLAGLGTGGSKYRILEFTIGAALEKGADFLIAAGFVQSNHPQQVAVAAARLALPSLVLLGDSLGPLVWQGNALLEQLSGAEVRLVPGADLDLLRQEQQQVAAEMRTRGWHPAIVTLTREVYIRSALAYARFMLELAEQLSRLEIRMDAIYVGSGGGTYAGILLGAIALDMPCRVIGLTPIGSAGTRSQYVGSLLEDAMQWLDLDLPIPGQRIEIYDDYLGEGYGIPSTSAVEAIRLVASCEGIFLDPIYSGKAMAGLIDHARQGRLHGQTVVFVHTGGLPTVFAYAEQLIPRVAMEPRIRS